MERLKQPRAKILRLDDTSLRVLRTFILDTFADNFTATWAA